MSLPLMQKTHILSGKTNLLGVILGLDHSRLGVIYGIWGLSPHVSLCLPLLASVVVVVVMNNNDWQLSRGGADQCASVQ